MSISKLLDENFMESDPLENAEVTATVYPSSNEKDQNTLHRRDGKMSAGKVRSAISNVNPSSKPLVEWTLGDYVLSVLTIGGLSVGLSVVVNAVLARIFSTNLHAFAASDIVIGALLIGAGAYAFLRLHGATKMIGVAVGVAGLFLVANGFVALVSAPKGGTDNTKNGGSASSGGSGVSSTPMKVT